MQLIDEIFNSHIFAKLNPSIMKWLENTLYWDYKDK